MGRLRIAAAATLALFSLSSRAAAQEPTLESVLGRAAAYVTEFQRQLSGVVAEESYVQDVRDSLASGVRSSSRVPIPHRELKSDLLLVKPVGSDRWIQFRDVFEVDGKPVRDRSERLVKLFVEPSSSTARQVQEIINESIRYNIGNILRTINVPVFALLVLEPGRQGHFRFTRVDNGPPSLARDFDVPAGAWTIRYQEVGRETMISTTNGRDIPSHGRFWIDPSTGRVLISELIAEDVTLEGAIVVKYQPGPVPDLLVPIAMRERYLERRSGIHIAGAATYGRFRQFQVKVDEKIAPIKEK
jgi:hypothetical protein